MCYRFMRMLQIYTGKQWWKYDCNTEKPYICQVSKGNYNSTIHNDKKSVSLALPSK